MAEKAGIESLREELFSALRALRDPKEPLDIERARAIADLGRVLVDSAKAENDFLRITGEQRGTGFIAAPELPAPPPGAPRLVRGKDQSGSR